jgi:hypothetical protein
LQGERPDSPGRGSAPYTIPAGTYTKMGEKARQNESKRRTEPNLSRRSVSTVLVDLLLIVAFKGQAPGGARLQVVRDFRRGAVVQAERSSRIAFLILILCIPSRILPARHYKHYGTSRLSAPPSIALGPRCLLQEALSRCIV